MYLHLGFDTVVRERDVIGIFDLDNASWSKHTRDYLNRAEQAGQARYVCEDLPKAFVVTEDRGESRVYLTQLSSQTLLKRAADNEFI